MIRSRVLLLSLLMLLGACATTPSEEAAVAQYVQQQKETARQLQQENKLAQALTVWQTVVTAGKPDTETRDAIAQLEADIASAVAGHIKRAKAAYQRGSVSQGDLSMLRALALQPTNHEALAALKQSAGIRARNQQHARVSANRPAPPSDIAHPLEEQLRTLYAQKKFHDMIVLQPQADLKNNAAAAALLRNAYIAIADSAEAEGNHVAALKNLELAVGILPNASDDVAVRGAVRVAALRKELALQWYRKGSQLITTDLDQCIVALRKSLQYDSSNTDARRKLAQAETLQKNLSRIQAQ